MNITKSLRRRKTREMMKLSSEEPSQGASEPGPAKAPSGVIRFETGKLPSEFAGYREEKRSNRPGRVVIVIVSLALIFIALIVFYSRLLLLLIHAA